jgi:acetyltransferase
VLSETITHKADAGGVQLNLHDAASVRRAYQAIESAVCARFGSPQFQGVTVQPMINLDGFDLIIGSSLDEQFGPVLLFGAGGRLVETYNDRALALPPLNTTLARRMMEQTRIFAALKGSRGRKPVDLGALEQLLVQFSRLVLDQVWIKEIEINPLLVSEKGQFVLDARVVLQEPNIKEESIPKSVIRPYPSQYTYCWNLKDGSPVTIRPIRPEDEPMMVKFHETLSDRSVYFRYFHPMRLTQRVAHERLVRMCFIDYDREIALVAVRKDPQAHTSELLGVGRLIKLHGCNDAEFAIVVSDRCQRQGLGTELLSRLVLIGRDEQLSRIVGDILPDNRGMLLVCERLGFTRNYSPASGVVKAEIEL